MNESEPAYRITPTGEAAHELMQQLEAWQSAGLAPSVSVVIAIQKLIDARITAHSAGEKREG